MNEAKTILVVEDDRHWREDIFVEVLEEAGWTVLTAVDRAQALDLLDRYRFAVIIVDINLTGVDGNTDGVTVIQDALARQQVSIVVVSGSQQRMRKYVQGLDIEAFIEKDQFEMSEFVETIRHILFKV